MVVRIGECTQRGALSFRCFVKEHPVPITEAIHTYTSLKKTPNNKKKELTNFWGLNQVR